MMKNNRTIIFNIIVRLFMSLEYSQCVYSSVYGILGDEKWKKVLFSEEEIMPFSVNRNLVHGYAEDIRNGGSGQDFLS